MSRQNLSALVIGEETGERFLVSFFRNIIAILDTNGNIVVEYTYDAWGNHKVLDSNGVENTQTTFIGNINPYRYRGYYYDTETGLYFLKTRYYDPTVGRFVSMDDVAYIDPETIGGTNLFAYCNNNPVMNFDPSGHMPKWLEYVIDIGIYVISAGSGDAVTFGVLNNLTNIIYYNYISDGISDLTSSSYQGRYINRWDRLDYVKSQDGMPVTYNSTVWRYFSEYNLHMYGWYVLGWAHEKGIPVISSIAESTANAEITKGEWDSRWYVNLGTVLLGLFGL